MTDKLSAYNAVKIMYNKTYELDKEFNFRIPQTKKELQVYVNKLRAILEEAFDTAQVNKMAGHEIKEATEEKKNNHETEG